MSVLYPTKTRVALLSAVDVTDRVAREMWCSGGEHHHRDTDTRTDRTVTARMTELEQAGWVRLNPQLWQVVDPVTMAGYERKYWELTDTGRAVLAAFRATT